MTIHAVTALGVYVDLIVPEQIKTMSYVQGSPEPDVVSSELLLPPLLDEPELDEALELEEELELEELEDELALDELDEVALLVPEDVGALDVVVVE